MRLFKAILDFVVIILLISLAPLILFIAYIRDGKRGFFYFANLFDIGIDQVWAQIKDVFR